MMAKNAAAPSWGGGLMSATGGSLPPIKPKGLYNISPSTRGSKGPGGPGGGPSWGSDSDDGWGNSGRPAGTKDRRSSPPGALIATAALIAPITVWLGPISRTGAVFVGMFVGVAMLGFIRLEINRRISSGRYADWSIPATRVATALFVTSWVIGALSMWRLAIEFSREFT
jgi:hypothetical protein